jgi:hypothetical protein
MGVNNKQAGASLRNGPNQSAPILTRQVVKDSRADHHIEGSETLAGKVPNIVSDKLNGQGVSTPSSDGIIRFTAFYSDHSSAVGSKFQGEQTLETPQVEYSELSPRFAGKIRYGLCDSSKSKKWRHRS